MLDVFEAKKLPNPTNYLTLANSCEKSAVTLSKHEVCGEKFGKKFENKFQPRPGLKLFVLFLREFLRDRPCPWQHNKPQQTTTPSPWRSFPAPSPRQNWPPNETFLFPFSAAPERFATPAPTARAEARGATVRVATVQPNPWPNFYVDGANVSRQRSSAKKDFRPARFCASRLIRRPRRATARRTARSMPRRTTHPFPSPSIFPPTRNPLRGTRCEGATRTSRPARCAGSWSTSSAVVGARGSPRSLSLMVPLLSKTHSCQ